MVDHHQHRGNCGYVISKETVVFVQQTPNVQTTSAEVADVAMQTVAALDAQTVIHLAIVLVVQPDSN
jgi:hypothetical protein